MRARGFLAAGILCGLQIMLVLATAPDHGYARLLNWDSFHYVDIADHGYHVVPNPTSDDVHGGRANAVFFPGYPWIARGVSQATGFSTENSLLLVSQGFCLLFWTYFFLFLQDLGLSERACFSAAGLVFLFPASFFLVVGYTESLFLAAALGFIYWIRRWMREPMGFTAMGFWMLAAVHGFMMCLTRIVGIGVAGYPILAVALFAGGYRKRPAPVRVLGALLLALASTEGALIFFLHCQSHLGDWRIYFKLEEIGWGNFTYPFALLDPRSYIPHFFREPTEDSISRCAVPLIAICFAGLAKTEWRSRLTGVWERLPIYLVAFFMFQIAVAAKANAKMDSMIRYSLPVFALLVLGGFWLRQERVLAGEKTRTLPRGVWIGAGMFSLVTQIWLAYRFTHGHWAA